MPLKPWQVWGIDPSLPYSSHSSNSQVRQNQACVWARSHSRHRQQSQVLIVELREQGQRELYTGEIPWHNMDIFWCSRAETVQFCLLITAQCPSQRDESMRKTGLYCPERLWCLFLWRYSKPAQTFSCGAYCRECAFSGSWTRWSPEVPSSPYNSVIHWFCEFCSDFHGWKRKIC